MIQIDEVLNFENFSDQSAKFWQLSGEKILSIEKKYDTSQGSPVCTRNGIYSTRGWTEWTQGFVFGSALLQFDATADEQFLEIGRQNTLNFMAPHISHIGVHDHGFNNVSTYGNLLRMMYSGKVKPDNWQKHFYELALKISGAIQASRWTTLPEGGYIHSFNGPHSLFVDTIRSCRALVLSYKLGHTFQAENDVKINLLKRAIEHMISTAKYAIYYGEGRDQYDLNGRTAHESIFNTKDGNYRCPNSQQGYTGFTTWTRGLAWAICGFAEQLEFLKTLSDADFETIGNKAEIMAVLLNAARASSDFYLEHTPICGVPYWDTGAPNLYKLGAYLNKPADPFNDFEPVDSSAAAIAAQGLLRLGHYLKSDGGKYIQAGLKITQTILKKPYLSEDKAHQGLLLHSIYHQPNGWDYVPEGSKIANGESSQWGDYHFRELMLYIKYIQKNDYYSFFSGI
jgi:unsaturated chondroitin disaccharide hydrolase